MQTPVLVLDNGGSTIKAGVASDDSPSMIMPNVTARIKKSLHELVGDETLTGVSDHSQLMYYRPIEKGYLVDYDLEAKVWHRLFDDQHLHVEPQDYCLYMSQPLFNMDVLMKASMEVVFEHFQFNSFLSAPSPLWAFHNHLQHLPDTCLSKHTRTGLVVESGFSFTHVVPIVDGHVVLNAVRRVNVGGKLLTNLLKETLSFRQVNVQDCTHLVNKLKEQYNYLSLDVYRDLERYRRNPAEKRVVFVLPDYVTSSTGYELKPGQRADPSQQILVLGNERFMVPEALFNPSDIGIRQAGVAETVGRCLRSFAPGVRELLLSNVLLTGGNVAIPNFVERFSYPGRDDVTPYVEEGKTMQLHKAEDPVGDTWRGGALLARRPEFASEVVTRAMYEENGATRILYNAFQCQWRDC